LSDSTRNSINFILFLPFKELHSCNSQIFLCFKMPKITVLYDYLKDIKPLTEKKPLPVSHITKTIKNYPGFRSIIFLWELQILHLGYNICSTETVAEQTYRTDIQLLSFVIYMLSSFAFTRCSQISLMNCLCYPVCPRLFIYRERLLHNHSVWY
jgi:hypothetical protein